MATAYPDAQPVEANNQEGILIVSIEDRAKAG
jgi:hypothetical protein